MSRPKISGCPACQPVSQSKHVLTRHYKFSTTSNAIRRVSSMLACNTVRVTDGEKKHSPLVYGGEGLVETIQPAPSPAPGSYRVHKTVKFSDPVLDRRLARRSFHQARMEKVLMGSGFCANTPGAAARGPYHWVGLVGIHTYFGKGRDHPWASVEPRSLSAQIPTHSTSPFRGPAQTAPSHPVEVTHCG